MKKVLLFNLLLAFALISEGQSIQNGLIGYYLFTGNAHDQTANANHGTVKGAIPTVDRFGNSDNAYYFDGDTSRIELPDSMLWAPSIYSISLWFKTDSMGGVIIGNQEEVFPVTPSHFNGVMYVGSNTGALRGKIWNGSNSPLGPSASVDDGSWHHGVMINYQSSQALYLDTILVDSVNGTIIPLDMVHNQIGIGYNHNWQDAPTAAVWNPFEGSIDDVRIYDRALSRKEIGELFNLPSIVGIEGGFFEGEITVQPNPTHDRVVIALDEYISKNTHIVNVLDLQGRLIFSKSLHKTKTVINLSECVGGSGIYLLQIVNVSDGSQYTEKVILQ